MKEKDKLITAICIVAVFAALRCSGLALVSGISMEPTFHSGDFVFTGSADTYQVNDIVICRFDGAKLKSIKRIIAEPNSTVEIKDEKCYVDGKYKFDSPGYNNKTWNLDDESYFVVGDNYNNSGDSRMYGPVQKEKIYKKVIWPK